VVPATESGESGQAAGSIEAARAIDLPHRAPVVVDPATASAIPQPRKVAPRKLVKAAPRNEDPDVGF
jgi:hypothetical protein